MVIAYQALEAPLAEASRAIAQSRTQIQGNPPEHLFHYTNSTGLIGILETSRLWATNYRYLNDVSEVNYGSSLVKSIVEEISQALTEDIAKEFLRRTIVTANAFEGMLDFYVACLCEDGDLLHQWTAYSDEGDGYAIGFQARQIGQRAGVESPAQDFFFRKVEYDADIQRRLIREVLELALSALREGTKGASVAEANNVVARCCKFVRDEAAEYLLCFKNPAFEVEKEWRICHVIGSTDSQRLSFRNGRFGITPYVSLDLSPMAGVNANRLPIFSIRHGPTRDAETIRFGLRKMLAQNGYAFVNISGTTLPLRA